MIVRMALPESLIAAAGQWSGDSKLHQSWEREESQQVLESASTLHIDLDRNRAFATLTYTWNYKGTEHEGVWIIAVDEKGKGTGGWTDSWHMNGTVMFVHGEGLNMKGEYEVPDHPNWGWRISLEPGKDALALKMWNISPDGDEEWAVEANYTKS